MSPSWKVLSKMETKRQMESAGSRSRPQSQGLGDMPDGSRTKSEATMGQSRVHQQASLTERFRELMTDNESIMKENRLFQSYMNRRFGGTEQEDTEEQLKVLQYAQ